MSYKWGSVEFNNALDSHFTEPPEYYWDFDPVEEAELQAERDEERLLTMQEDF